MPWPIKNVKTTNFSEEDVCIVSKRDPCVVFAGTKVLFSGIRTFYTGSGADQASGYNYGSGETDVQPISVSGWGEIRVPEVGQLHKLFVFPKTPHVFARSAYVNKPAGYPGSGIGGCSGKVCLLKWMEICSSGALNVCSNIFVSGAFSSGEIDIIAFGSEY